MTGRFGGNFLQEVPPKPPSRTPKRLRRLSVDVPPAGPHTKVVLARGKNSGGDQRETPMARVFWGRGPGKNLFCTKKGCPRRLSHRRGFPLQ